MILSFVCADVDVERALKSPVGPLGPSIFYCSQLLNLRWVGALGGTALASVSFRDFPLQWKVSLMSLLFPKQPFGGVRPARLSQWLGTDPLGS